MLQTKTREEKTNPSSRSKDIHNELWVTNCLSKTRQLRPTSDEGMTITQLFVSSPTRDIDENGFQYNISWEPSKCQGCSAWFKRLVAIVKHHKAVHSQLFLAFICQKCQRSFWGPHAALCHYSKCGGVTITVLHQTCNICNRGFRSLSRLRQHERHWHPEQRLAARTVTARRPGQSLPVWNDQEVQAVLDFMIPITTKAGLRHYDRRLTAILTSKTPTQIREKVRGLRDTGKLPRPNDLFSSDSNEIEEENSDPVVLPPDMPPIAVFDNDEARFADQEWEAPPNHGLACHGTTWVT